MPSYFARVTRGLEDTAASELSTLRGLTIDRLDTRRIDFRFSPKPHRLLGLRSVDDVYLEIARYDGIRHKREALDRIAALIAPLDLNPFVSLRDQVRPLPPDPSFSVSPTLSGQRNYSRYEVEDAVCRAVSDAHPWRRVALRDADDSADLNFRLLVEGEQAIFGLALADHPLHRRAYKQDSQPGALKAPVAYCLCLLAGLTGESLVLDPMGGSGTTMIEATLGFRVRSAITVDLDPNAARLAQANAARAGMPLTTLTGSAAALPLPPHGVNAIVSNLPWGRQVQTPVPLGRLYRDVLREAARVLVPGGRAVLLTTQTEDFAAALEGTPGLALLQTHPISLYGSHPTIFILTPSIP